MNSEELVFAPVGVCVCSEVGLVNYLLGSHDSGTCRVRVLRGLVREPRGLVWGLLRGALARVVSFQI